MIKKYSTSKISSIHKEGDYENLECIKCGAEIELNDKIDLDIMVVLGEDPTICKKCKLEGENK